MTHYTSEAEQIAARVEEFVRTVVAPYEADPRCGSHGPSDELGAELRGKAKAVGLLVPHIRKDGSHFSHADTALILRKSGISPLGPIACHVMAPDEGNMYLLGKVGSDEIKQRFLAPLASGDARSAFFMTEPYQMEKLVPQPQLATAFGFRIWKDWPIRSSTKSTIEPSM